MNLVSSDLNLLVSLGALLEERNVTRAAARLGVRQPTMSSALRKLRAHFGDELLVRVGGSYQLSPLAQTLSLELPEILRSIERTFLERPEFDPATSTRRFRIVGSDFAVAVISPVLMPLLADIAPYVRLGFESIRPMTPDEAEQELLDVDFLLAPDAYQLEMPRMGVFVDSWACISGVPRPSSLTVESLVGSSWVRVFGSTVGASLGFFDRLDDVLPESSDQVTVGSFAVVPWIVAGTDRLGFIQRRMLQPMQAAADIHPVRIELALPSINEMAWWHPSRSADPAHLWMRGVLQQVAAELDQR